MVRRRKYRKNWNRRNDSDVEEETVVPVVPDVETTEAAQNDKPATPSCTPKAPPERSKSRNSIKSTPVNKRRVYSRRRNSLNRTMNVTNLNILFDSSYINQGTPPPEDRRSVGTPKAETSSSSANVGFHANESIFETPKLSQYSLIEDFVSQLRSSDRAPLDKSKIHYLDSNVNINPYVNNPEIKFVNREPSLGEISFFTPQLYNLKLASTPIDKIAENIMKDSPIKESPNNVKINNVDPVKVDKISNFVFQSTPVADTTDKENLINLQRSRNISPKTHRPKNFTIVHNLSKVSKTTNSGYRTFAGDQQDARVRVDVVFDRLKRLSRTSIRWTIKIVDLCNYIGVALRKSVSSIFNFYRTEELTPQQSTTTLICKCSDYHCQLRNCTSEIEQLRTELVQVRSQMDLQRSHHEEIRQLGEELFKLKQQLDEFREIKSELSDLKERLKHSRCDTPPPAPPLPPTLPPPPPPPPPPPAQHVPKIAPAKTKRASNKNKENSRPIISLDDILKVKLKKAGERPSPYRRSSQPVVSTEMLKQVKLKPASRPQTPINEELSTSPHSSLTRLLNDNSVWKTKPVGETGEGANVQLNGVT